MKDLTPARVKEITEYLLVETELCQADLCMVFGGGAADQLADHAAKLYKQGLFKKIIVSGGVETDDGTLEADRIKARLVGWGVPAGDILAERQATNTGENVTYGLPMLDKAIGLENIKRVICIGQIHASRRFLMTLHKHWPEVDKMFTAPNHFNVPKEQWHKDPDFCEAVLREIAKIEPYKKVGFLAEVDIDEMNRKALAYRREATNDNARPHTTKHSRNKPPRQ